MDITTPRLAWSPRDPSVDRRRWSAAPAGTASSVAHGAEVSLATITDLPAFEALGPEWDSLFATSGAAQQVFQTFAWLAIWAPLYLGNGTRLAVVTGRVDGRLVMVWPLVVKTTFGLRVLSFMGEPLSQYGDALMATGIGDNITDAAFDYVMAMPVDVISLRRIRDDAAIASLLRRRLGEPVNRQASPIVDFTGSDSVDAFEKRFPGKLRASRRRRRRRLEERGPVTFTHLRPSAEAAGYAATALGFKREWARQTGVVAPALRDRRFAQFFVTAALAGPKAPDLRVSVLRAGADVFGIEISVVCKGQLFGHILAPRPGCPQLGLGGILAELTVTNALEQGYFAIDLLAPADPYKLEWTSTCIGVGDYALPISAKGSLYTRLWLRHGRRAVKTIIAYLQPGIGALSRRFKGAR